MIARTSGENRWTSHLLLALLSTRQLAVVLATGLNARTLLFTAATLALTVLVCGLAPSLAARGELAEELKVQGPERNARRA